MQFSVPNFCIVCSTHTRDIIHWLCSCAGIVIKKDCSPGPAHAIDPKFTRHGKDGTPQYSILGRQKDQCKCIQFVRSTI